MGSIGLLDCLKHYANYCSHQRKTHLLKDVLGKDELSSCIHLD